jgi:hypothetical protein
VHVTRRSAKTREIRLSIEKAGPKPADKLKHVLYKKPSGGPESLPGVVSYGDSVY